MTGSLLGMLDVGTTPHQMAVPEFRGNPGKLPDLIVLVIIHHYPNCSIQHFQTDPNKLRWLENLRFLVFPCEVRSRG